MVEVQTGNPYASKHLCMTINYQNKSQYKLAPPLLLKVFE